MSMNDLEKSAIKEADKLFYEYIDKLEEIAIKHEVDKYAFIIAAMSANISMVATTEINDLIKIKNKKVGK